MTKNKRFTIYYYNDCMVEDNLTGEDYLIDEFRKPDAKKLCDLLNKQHELIELLEGQLTTYNVGCREIYDDNCRLQGENTILRREYETLLKLVWDSGIDYVVCDELEDLE